jgi:adenosylcobinamide-GDP ribazoletransferase
VIRQLELFLVALQFLTRLPVPSPRRFEADAITRGARYFPLVGQIVGALSAGVLLLASRLWGGWIPALLAVAAGVAITGALHEDGLADTADGLVGGRDTAQRLAIMKDSRIGTYGALALGLGVAIRVAALSVLSPLVAALSLMAAHGVARAAAVVVMRALPYAGDAGSAKVVIAPSGPTRLEVLMAVILAAWPLVFLPPTRAVLGCVIGGILALGVALAARRLVGGQRGDILGAVEQVCEAGFLLGCAVLIGVAR